MSTLLKNVTLNNQITDILIEDTIFKTIAPNQDYSPSDTIIDCTDKAILPAFYNNHSHAPMSILRGIGDDKDLFDWLNNDIWPREAKLTPEMIYTATKFAILEMIKTGTTFFSDMYFCMNALMQAVADMGIRATLSFGALDFFDINKRKSEISKINDFLEMPNPSPNLISKAIGIHAVYSASPELIRYNVELAHKNNLKLHIHACETLKEVQDCQKQFGCSPIVHLNNLGALSENTILAHSVFLNDDDIKILAEKKVWLCSNPSSNYKLASGVFMFQKLFDAGCRITLGTDGAASNNNLSMIEEMNLCALSAKIQNNSPTSGKALDIFKIATQNGAEAFGLNAGCITEGKLADCILVNLNNHLLIPNYNLISNMVYSADSSCIDTLICNGKILMQNHHIKGEENLITEIKKLSDFFKN